MTIEIVMVTYLDDSVIYKVKIDGKIQQSSTKSGHIYDRVFYSPDDALEYAKRLINEIKKETVKSEDVIKVIKI